VQGRFPNQILHCKPLMRFAIRAVGADIAAMTNVQISLPDGLAHEAQRAGLLDSETLAAILREQLAVKQVETLQTAKAKLAADPLPPMSPGEIRNEIEAYRSEKQRAAGRRYQRCIFPDCYGTARAAD
jgi:hypothetical protein